MSQRTKPAGYGSNDFIQAKKHDKDHERLLNILDVIEKYEYDFNDGELSDYFSPIVERLYELIETKRIQANSLYKQSGVI